MCLQVGHTCTGYRYVNEMILPNVIVVCGCCLCVDNDRPAGLPLYIDTFMLNTISKRLHSDISMLTK